MKKRLKALATITISFAIAIIAANAVYLSGLIDWYKPELSTYNPAKDLADDNKLDTVLIMGDSFTAGNHSYPNILRTTVPKRIINSGVSGTGIREAGIMAQKRIERFKPKVFIYQIYTGNDLFDIDYPVSRQISPARNLYWFVSNNLRITAFINYRMGQIKATRGQKYAEYTESLQPSLNEEFSIEKYAKREVVYNTAEPKLINDSILLKDKRAKDFPVLTSKLNKILNLLPAGCQKIVVVIPHKAQVTGSYLNESRKTGAEFSEPDRILDVDYPFIVELKKQLPSDVIVLNALAPLRQAEAAGTKVYYANDGHLNPNGQKILAGSIASYLQ